VIGLFVGISVSYFTFWRIFDQVFVDYQNHIFVAKNSNSTKRIEKPIKDLKELEVSLGFVKLIFSDGSNILFMPPGLGITLQNEAKYIVQELKIIAETNVNRINKEKIEKI
jgi:hypothetical protein